MKIWVIFTVVGVSLLWGDVASARRLTPSIRRKLTRPSAELRKLVVKKRSYINGTKRIANVIFSSLPMAKGIPNERRYKLRRVFKKGDTILYRAYRPANIMTLMNKVARDSVSRGCQTDIQIFGPGRKQLKGMFHESFNYPRRTGLKWDMTRGTVWGPGGKTDFLRAGRRVDFHKYMAKQKPGKYRVLVTVWEKIAKVGYFRKLYRGRWSRMKRTKIHKYYLSAAGTFTYVVR